MPLLQEKRSVTYAIVFGIWAEVFLYCVLHDQYRLRSAAQAISTRAVFCSLMPGV